MDLFIEISPDTVYSSFCEPCEIKNQLVFQLHNLSDDSITFYNDAKLADYDFLPIEKAQPLDGLSMIYLVFSIDSDSGSLTTEKYFGKTCIFCPEEFLFKRVGADTLVLFPKETLTLSANDLTEFVIDELVSFFPSDNLTLCRSVFFMGGEETFFRSIPIHFSRHPLSIPVFEIAPGEECASFREQIKFRYRALGTDTCMYSPGDVALARDTEKYTEGEFTCELARRTNFALTAFSENKITTRSFELIPLTAAIKNFSGTVAKDTDGIYTATLKFTVLNTRHVFLNQIGRIVVKSGVEQTITCRQKNAVKLYTLMVENEDGILKATCYPSLIL